MSEWLRSVNEWIAANPLVGGLLLNLVGGLSTVGVLALWARLSGFVGWPKALLVIVLGGSVSLMLGLALLISGAIVDSSGFLIAGGGSIATVTWIGRRGITKLWIVIGFALAGLWSLTWAVASLVDGERILGIGFLIGFVGCLAFVVCWSVDRQVSSALGVVGLAAGTLTVGLFRFGQMEGRSGNQVVWVGSMVGSFWLAAWCLFWLAMALRR